MKRFLILILLLTSITVKAQTENETLIHFSTLIGSGVDLSRPASTPFLWQLMGYRSLSSHWAVGAGMGLSFYNKLLIPLYGNVRYQLRKIEKITPYAELLAGYSFAPAYQVDGGFYASPCIGVKYPLNDKIELLFAIGYEYQELERLREEGTGDAYITYKESLNHSLITFKVGMSF